MINDDLYHARGSNEGGSRSSDPHTSRAAARSIDTRRTFRLILQYLSQLQEPRNGWEISSGLDRHTTGVVPRLCPMRTINLITYVCDRPGPSKRGQMSYIIAERGRQALTDPAIMAAAVAEMARLSESSPLSLYDRARAPLVRLSDEQWEALKQEEDQRRGSPPDFLS